MPPRSARLVVGDNTGRRSCQAPTRSPGALNRRVALNVDAAPTVPVPATEGELPPGPDLTAPGAEGVLLGAPFPRPWRVRVPSARLVEGHVVADVLVGGMAIGRVARCRLPSNICFVDRKAGRLRAIGKGREGSPPVRRQYPSP